MCNPKKLFVAVKEWNNNDDDDTKNGDDILLEFHNIICRISQVALTVKNLPSNARDTRDVGLIPGSGRSPGVDNNPL